MRNFFVLLTFIASCLPLKAQISGTVFRDFNANGIQDNSASFNEPFVQGITITAYDASGASVGTLTSDANGAYSFTGLTLPLRIEFSGYQTGDYTAPSGSGSNTSVQFYTAASSAANFGVNYPSDYCQNNPPLAVNAFVWREPDHYSPSYPSVVHDLYTDRESGDRDIFDHTVNHSYMPQTGATYGMAYARSTQTIYVAAFNKNMSGFGPGNVGADGSTGAIYKIQGGTTSVLLDLDPSLGGTYSTGTNLHPNTSSDWFCDDAWRGIGKVGWGDLDISDDETVLYGVNLSEQTLVKINALNGAILGSYKIPGITGGIVANITTCSNNPDLDLIPFALKYYRNKVYVGVTCSAASNGVDSDLHAYVFQFNPVNNTFDGTPVLDADIYSLRNTYEAWWEATDAFGKQHAPLLTDIEFYEDNMLIAVRKVKLDGIASRAGTTFGPGCTEPSGNTNSAGNIYIACKNGSNTWTLESGGNCGSLTGFNTSYFFQQDAQHDNDYLGSLAVLQGTGEIAATAIPGAGDGAVAFINYAARTYDVGGIKIVNDIISDATDNDGDGQVDNFLKANGLGDIELLCNPAPLEIGNRIWSDTDNDGVQDANEAGIDGITVELYEGTTLVGTATTANGGQWYFNNTNVNQNGATELKPNTDYTVRVPSASFPTGKTLTGTNTDGTANGDVRDNDATLVGGNAEIAYTTGNYGQNDHTLDMGFKVAAAPLPDLSLTKTVNTAIATLNGTVTFTLTLTNDNDIDATGVVVTDNLPAGVTFVSVSDPANATHSGGVITWNVGNMLGTDAPKTLQITVIAANEGSFVNTTEITSMNETDTDSTPNNDIVGEDDQDQACFSVPVKLCSDNAAAIITVTSGAATSWQWYVSTDNGVTYTALSGETSQALVINNSLMGGNNVTKYFKVAYNGAAITDGCGDVMCCPIIVTTEICTVCPPSKCISIGITKH